MHYHVHDRDHDCVLKKNYHVYDNDADCVWRIAIILYAIITFPMAGGGGALPCSKS